MNLRHNLFLLLLLLSLAVLAQATPTGTTVDTRTIINGDTEDPGAKPDECFICLRSLDNEHQDAHMLEHCTHDDRYHPDCLQNWLYSSNSCPVCRQPARVRRRRESRSGRHLHVEHEGSASDDYNYDDHDPDEFDITMDWEKRRDMLKLAREDDLQPLRWRRTLHRNIPAGTSVLPHGNVNEQPRATLTGWYSAEKRIMLERVRRIATEAVERHHEVELQHHSSGNQDDDVRHFRAYMDTYERALDTLKVWMTATFAFLDDPALGLNSFDTLRERYFAEGAEGHFFAEENWYGIRMMSQFLDWHFRRFAKEKRVLRNCRRSLNKMVSERSATESDIAALYRELKDGDHYDLLRSGETFMSEGPHLLYRLRLTEMLMEESLRSSATQSGETEE